MANCYSLSIPKLERKTIEKNRRNNMKTLYSHLSSLLPPKETGFAVTDQIDDAIDYIKNLQTKIEEAEEKKKQLLERGTKRKQPSPTTTAAAAAAISGDIPRSAEIDVRETGPTVDVAISICGLDMNYLFYDTIRVIHQEGGDVITANSSIIGNSVFYTLHATVKNYPINYHYGRITKRLQELIHGQQNDDLEEQIDHDQLDLWKFDAHSDIWEFEFPQVLML
ncbi:transcription factor bHLH162-like [Impatiens glandulifera]|uniref:transcription factor bHLH162-like n=1 Tax=Impatiens glandulifera TaxID=253017 RepID=UPI001FB0CF01|nr:transcription factor bHLH162-like [Impatiens glandulifera]